MKKTKLALMVDGQAQGQKDALTADLQDFLTQHVQGVSTRRVRRNPDTQDAGATLIAVLAAPAMVQLAHALRDWIAKRQVRVSIAANGSSSVTGSPASVERIVKRLALSKPVPSPKKSATSKKKKKSM